MVKNAVKKFATFCLLAVLCVPCCLASADPYSLSLADQDEHVRAAVEAEVARCAQKEGVKLLVDPSEMDGDMLMVLYNHFLGSGTARSLDTIVKSASCRLDSAQGPEDPQYSLSLADQDPYLRRAVEDEVAWCAEKHGIELPSRPMFMTGEELMSIYNQFLARRIARPLGILMKI